MYRFHSKTRKGSGLLSGFQRGMVKTILSATVVLVIAQPWDDGAESYRYEIVDWVWPRYGR